jgi:RNA polymerase-binding transcription factor DksA
MSAHFTASQSAALKAALRSRFESLRGKVHEHLLKSDDERARLLADSVRDAEDESVADLLIDLDLAEIDRDLEELRDVEDALARMEQTTYGVCSDCRTLIPLERMTAYPTAKRCFRCQTLHEKTYAGKSMPKL